MKINQYIKELKKHSRAEYLELKEKLISSNGSLGNTDNDLDGSNGEGKKKKKKKKVKTSGGVNNAATAGAPPGTSSGTV